MFRIHPRTREFQVFCEGTSNPWGIAFNDEGDAFVSACVIDHLWHLVETGYYHRQGGPYPPHTWKIDSIVKHKHQKAAYCGITWFDSDAYPEKYRKKLYMGNIHGGCINVDRIERNGSTYAGFGEPDFLTANDAWFMPVVQKTGPDGCLYILDWYDRYHCYQDANRDPKGIDRLKGRLYRVRYEGERRGISPTWKAFDLANESDDDLIKKLGDANVWTRETAQRLLQERTDEPTTTKLVNVALSKEASKPQRRHALFAALGRNIITMEAWDKLEIAAKLFDCDDPMIRPWAIRLLTNQGLPQLKRSGSVDSMDGDLGGLVVDALGDDDPRMRLQGLIYVTQISRERQPYLAFDDALLAALRKCGNDPVLQRTAWQAVKAYGGRYPKFMTKVLSDPEIQHLEIATTLIPRLLDWMLTQPNLDVAALRAVLSQQTQKSSLSSVMRKLAELVQSGELTGDRLAAVKNAISPEMSALLRSGEGPLFIDATLLATSWRDPAGSDAARKIIESANFSDGQRLAATSALIAAGQDEVLRSLAKIFEASPPVSIDFRGKLLAALGRLDDPEVGKFTLHFYPRFEAELQPRAIELLTQRPAWAKTLLTAVGEKKVAASAINVNQARRLYDTKDAEVRELLAKHWGQVREGRSPDRDKIIAEMRSLIRKSPGDSIKGEAAFKKVCAQCHKLYGEGAEVGPDITLNGRNDYTQLLSNVFDPSLVIGAGYRSYTVITQGGRVINGLLVEESPQRVVLKVQGGKQEIIPRDDIDEFKVSEISLMPEQLEKQLSQQEIIDLFAYITLDKPPRDPSAKRLPGVYDVVPRASENATDFAAIFQEVAPGFTQVTSGEGGVALLKDHMGRPGVVRTHPISRDKPAEMSGKFAIPAGMKSKLVIDVSHDPRGDWRLVVGNSAGRLLDEMVNKDVCKNGWATFTVDLTRFAGEEVQIRMWNQANDWAYEFAYWGSVRVVSDP